MHKNIFIITVFFSLLSYFSNAQELSDKESSAKNYFMSSISYTNSKYFEDGSSIGIAYHRMFSDKFGANASYSKATTHEVVGTYYSYSVSEVGHEIDWKMTSCHSANIGLTYRTVANRNHELLTTLGFNYQYVYYNYIKDIHLSDDSVNLALVYDSFGGYGVYFSLDYLYFITKEFAVGIHGAYEYSPSAFSIANAGVSLAYRF